MLNPLLKLLLVSELELDGPEIIDDGDYETFKKKLFNDDLNDDYETFKDKNNNMWIHIVLGIVISFIVVGLAFAISLFIIPWIGELI